MNTYTKTSGAKRQLQKKSVNFTWTSAHKLTHMVKACVIICVIICMTLLLCEFKSEAFIKGPYVIVEAGPYDRRDTVVSFALPNHIKAKAYALRDGSGHQIPLQVNDDGRATFVLPELKAGATVKFRLEELKQKAAPSTEGVQLIRERNRLTISIAGHQLLGYQAQGELPRDDIKPIFLRGGYIHPVFTPSGRMVTDDYPPKHLHHHGVWFSWTKTEFEGRKPDFWNMGDGTGTVEFVSLDETWAGPVQAGFKSHNKYVDLSGQSPKTALNEVWEVTAYRVGQGKKPYYMFDLVSTQECATTSPLVLPEYHYGGVGFRGNHAWDGKENASFLTSEGKDRTNGHGTRARWCHISGVVDGQVAGIAILGHPDNFRAPQPMRIHPDEPFFCFAPSQLGLWEITAGKQYVSRYRFIVSDGPPDAAEINRLWNDYANPLRVTVQQ